MAAQPDLPSWPGIGYYDPEESGGETLVRVDRGPSACALNRPPDLSVSLHDLPELPFHVGPIGQPPQFELGRSIGSGGMGVIHEAQQVALARGVAVKQLRDSGDEQARLALLREALVTGRLEHPNIVPVHTLGKTEDGAPVMVMKVIRGTSWGAVIRRPVKHAALMEGRDPLAFHLEVLCAVCNAIHFAHSQHVLHRDIKPDNVMIGAFGEVSVLDWGLAVLLEPVEDLPLPLASEVWRVAGTPGFIAPEMCSPEDGSIGVHSDVYLLGATLHYILTRRPRHAASTIEDALEQARRSEPPEWGPDVPAELAAICDRACHVDPARRHPSAEALRRDILDYLRHRGALEQLAWGTTEVAHIRELVTRAGASAQLDRRIIEARFALTEGLRGWPEHAEGRRALSELDALIDRRAAEHASLLHQAWESDVTVGQVARLRALELDAGAAFGICLSMYLALRSGVVHDSMPYVLALGGFALYWGARLAAHWLYTARARLSRTSGAVERAQAIGHAAATLAFAGAWHADVDFGLAVALWSLLHATVYLIVEATTSAGAMCCGYLFMVAAALMVFVPEHALLLCAIASAAEWATLVRLRRAVSRG